MGTVSGGFGYRKLAAWQLADDLAVDVYSVVKTLPPAARPLSSQIIRAATSAPANIAEGYGRASRQEFRQFLAVAHASLYELSYFLHFLSRINALDATRERDLSDRARRASSVEFGLMRVVSEGANKRRYLPDRPKGAAA
jgi:four helix bundle protein